MSVPNLTDTVVSEVVGLVSQSQRPFPALGGHKSGRKRPICGLRPAAEAPWPIERFVDCGFHIMAKPPPPDLPAAGAHPQPTAILAPAFYPIRCAFPPENLPRPARLYLFTVPDLVAEILAAIGEKCPGLVVGPASQTAATDGNAT